MSADDETRLKVKVEFQLTFDLKELLYQSYPLVHHTQLLSHLENFQLLVFV